MIYIGPDKVEDYKFGVIRYTIKIGKTCTYVTLKYANCRAKYQATTFCCLVRLKTLVEV